MGIKSLSQEEWDTLAEPTDDCGIEPALGRCARKPSSINTSLSPVPAPNNLCSLSEHVLGVNLDTSGCQQRYCFSHYKWLKEFIQIVNFSFK